MRRRAGERKGFWVASAIATLIYTLIASPRLGGGPRLKAQGIFRIPEPQTIGAQFTANVDWSAFSNLDNFGFYSPRGVEVAFHLEPMAASDGTCLLEPLPERGIIAAYRYLEGRKVDLPFAGYPFLESSRVFLIRQDQQGVSEIDAQGRTIWDREFGSTLTSVSAVTGHSAWGTLGGEILVQVGQDAFITLLTAESGLEPSNATVYSVAISPDGKAMVALCGQDPQYALYYQLEGGRYSLAHSVKLQRATTRAEASVFSADGSFSVTRTASGLLVYLSRDRKSSVLQAGRFGGETDVLMKPWGRDRIAILSASNSGRYLSLVRKAALEACIRVDDDATGLSLGRDDSLVVSGRSYVRLYSTTGISR
jgi:hypothetical protein